ncbi:hypothetical protein KFL_000370050 [Klebsormidium nitens]|uniref:Uncharacterized protein n=1 Tax=Klebsormidium nitens TaxID=105231 RepID=A0A1Y1HRX5_KLENI|nr:hypothetical protein KFL_000370050 [Klebsormidium nitens]|eukprot:GAQ79731.1 hypothetical protein KFL_000370050 [Klebsormidium nitens]
MVNDVEIARRVQEKLKTADLQTTTERQLRKQLEEELGVDLTEKKTIIRAEIQKYLDAQQKEEDDDDDDEEEEESAAVDEEEKPKRGGGGGFATPCNLSPQLANLLGAPRLTRNEIVKKLWEYIKGHNLQDAENKRNIHCDAALQELFGVTETNMFEVNKLLAKHIFSIHVPKDPNAPKPKPRPRKPKAKDDEPKGKKGKKGKEEEDDGKKKKKKRAKRQKKEPQEGDKPPGPPKGLLRPLPISDELSEFFGMGEKLLPRTEVVKRLWAYIKEHNLQDPADKRVIIADAKLARLMGQERFNGFGMTKVLQPHFGAPLPDPPVEATAAVGL